MKKYIAPEMDIVKFASENIMLLSSVIEAVIGQDEAQGEFKYINKLPDNE